MSEWTSTTLGNVIKLQRGHDLPSSERTHGTVPVIGSFGVTGFHDEARYSGPGVAIGRSGASIGSATFVVEDYWPLNTCLFVRDFKSNDPRWVYRLLDMTDFAGFNSGSAQPSLNRNFLADIPVRLPPVVAQRAIAEVLGALDDKIAANAAMVSTIDELAAAVARSALSGAEESLSVAADIVMGSSPPGTSYNESGVGTVFYQGVRDFGVRSPANRVWTTEPVRMAAATDTLVSVRAPVGRTNLASEDTCIGRGLAGVRSRRGRPMTLFHLIRLADKAWAPFESEDTVFGSINRKNLSEVAVGVVEPSAAESLEIQLAALEGRIASALSESSGLASTRDTLLPGLMSGKIRVKDAERVVEEAV